MISIQNNDFDQGAEYQRLRDHSRGSGAITTFTGLVRDLNNMATISAIELEYYPEMAEKVLAKICDEARNHWSIDNIRLIHRVGRLNAYEQIVFVGISARHRHDALHATEFIMDQLKTQAPFWKKEGNIGAMQWVEIKNSDAEAALRWSDPMSKQPKSGKRD